MRVLRARWRWAAAVAGAVAASACRNSDTPRAAVSADSTSVSAGAVTPGYLVRAALAADSAGAAALQDSLGREGWEMVSFAFYPNRTAFYYFKRALK